MIEHYVRLSGLPASSNPLTCRVTLTDRWVGVMQHAFFTTYEEAQEAARNLTQLFNAHFTDEIQEARDFIARRELRDHYRNTSHGKAD